MNMEQFKPMTDLIEAVCVNLLDANITYSPKPYTKEAGDTWVTVQSRQGFSAVLLRNAWLADVEGSSEEADNCLIELLTAVNKSTRKACSDIVEGFAKIPEDLAFIASRRQAKTFIDHRTGEFSILIFVDGRVRLKS